MGQSHEQSSAGSPQSAPSDIPRDLQEATATMGQASIPVAVRELASLLQSEGFETVVVGGAVRDALLGREHGDWDVATSATPDEVKRVCSKTIDTGLAHGTVTVMVGRGAQRTAVEVTTYRGDGEYLDGRRPEQVTFHRSLVEDLARRDFTMNAMAYDPVAEVFHDPFDGLKDLREGTIRAVGEPMRRFSEDGLRPIRGLRFCASLGFRLDPQTLSAMKPCLPVFLRVSRERIWVELLKLLAAPRPSLGLVPMRECGMWRALFPTHDLVGTPAQAGALSEHEDDVWASCVAAVDTLPADPIVRLAVLLQGGRIGFLAHDLAVASKSVPDARTSPGLTIPQAAAESANKVAAERSRDLDPSLLAAIEALKPSREQRARLAVLVSPRVLDLMDARGGVAIRRAAAAIGREHLVDAIAVLRVPTARAQALTEALEHAAVHVRELAIRGQDLMDAGVAQPGPMLGQQLVALLDWVIEDPRRNVRDELLTQAAKRSTPASGGTEG